MTVEVKMATASKWSRLQPAFVAHCPGEIGKIQSDSSYLNQAQLHIVIAHHKKYLFLLFIIIVARVSCIFESHHSSH